MRDSMIWNKGPCPLPSLISRDSRQAGAESTRFRICNRCTASFPLSASIVDSRTVRIRSTYVYTVRTMLDSISCSAVTVSWKSICDLANNLIPTNVRHVHPLRSSSAILTSRAVQCIVLKLSHWAGIALRNTWAVRAIRSCLASDFMVMPVKRSCGCLKNVE